MASGVIALLDTRDHFHVTIFGSQVPAEHPQALVIDSLSVGLTAYLGTDFPTSDLRHAEAPGQNN